MPEQKPDFIYMDAMGFGMGCCCLQVTFQACNIGEARKLYDQLTPLCPVMVSFRQAINTQNCLPFSFIVVVYLCMLQLALTAATPFYRGYVSDVDCRWDIIAGSVDCRFPEERTRIAKSRYDSVDLYL